jgi:hypothetical protein
MSRKTSRRVRPGQAQGGHDRELERRTPGDRPTPERLARGDVCVMPLVERSKVGERDGTGEGPDVDFREVVVGFARRSLNALAAERLRRIKLSDDSAEAEAMREAAGLFEADHELSGLQPSLVVNLHGAGVPRRSGRPPASDVRERVLDAADRLHAARQALRPAGPAVVAVTEAVVLHGSTLDVAAQGRYSDKGRNSVFALTCLGVGLAILAEHYRGAGRMRRDPD